MDIKLSQKDYKNLLRLVGISSHIYGIMSDAVSPKYKKDAEENDALIDKLLSYNDDPDIEETFEGKKGFSDIHMDETMTDLMEYEEFSFRDMLGEKMANKILAEKLQATNNQKTMTEDEIAHEVFQIEEKLENDFVDNGLDNISYTGKL